MTTLDYTGHLAGLTAIKYDKFDSLLFEEISNEKGKFRAAVEKPGNIRLIGETGTGKSTLVHVMARELKGRVFQYSLTQETTRYDLLAERTLQEGSSDINPGIVLLWLGVHKEPMGSEGGGYRWTQTAPEKGILSILFLDEWNYARPEVKSFINQLSDFRRSVWVPEMAQEFTRTPQHIVVIAMNPHEKVGYGGTVEENIAQTRRFESIRLTWLPRNIEVKLLEKHCKDYPFRMRLVEWANKIRKIYAQGNISAILTTENLATYAYWYDKDLLAEKEIVDIAASLFTEEDRDAVVRLWESKEEGEAATKAAKGSKEDK